ncbi:zinc finger C2H2-type/integrase DNA-binding domain-containing protein [Tanacetum coccineum]
MESQEGFIQNAATVLSSTPTHGVRKIVIRLKTPMRYTNTMILHGGTSYAHGKEMERSCFSNAEKKNGKRVLDMECKTEFQENIKKAKRQTDVASTTNALYKPAVTRYDEIKKPTDAFKKGKVPAENRKKMIMNFEGKPACPICRKNCVSTKFLYQHMVLHKEKDWKTFIRSLNTHSVNKIDENHSHEPKVVDLSKCEFGWNVKTGKRDHVGSSVADVKVNNYLGLGRYDLREVDEDVKEAAKILVLMARDHQLKSKTSMAIQREEEAAKCLMCLDDPVSPPMVISGAQVEQLMATSMTERNLQVEESADTISSEIKGVRSFDLNELPEFEDLSLTE